MPAGYFDEDDDDQEFEDRKDSGPKGLRAALAKANKEKDKTAEDLAAALKQIEELTGKVKAVSLKDAMSEAGLDPKFAKFADRDGVEPTKEAVAKWADENKDVYAFLAKPAPAGDDEDPDDGDDGAADDELPPELRDAIAASQKLEQGGRPSGSANTLNTLEGMSPTDFKDRKQLLAALEKLGAPIG